MKTCSVITAGSVVMWWSHAVLATWPTDPTVNVPLCTEAGGQYTTSGSAVADGGGGAIVAWIDMRNDGSAVWAQRVDSAGETLWAENGVPICTAAGSQATVQTVTDGAGGAIMVWLDYRGADADYWAQRVNAAGEILWPSGSPSTDGVPLVTLAGNQQHLVVAADGAGGAIVAWRHDSGVTDGIYAQRLDSAGDLQWPDGAPSTDGVTVVETDGAQLWPGIDIDGSGGVVIAWTDGRDAATAQTDIYAQRLDAGGAAVWTPDGVPLCRADYGQVFPMVVSDGSGGAIVAWQDYRGVGAGLDIYAQRVSSIGSTAWAPLDGILVSDTCSNGEGSLQALSDGAGGAYLVWIDVRNAAVNGLDLFAQRVSGAGSELWVAGGVVVSAAPDKQQTFDAVSHGPGGVIVSWTDFRDDTFTDIYAQRLNSMGVPSGPADGLAVCTAFSSQYASTIVSDGAGGAIIAWYDFRDNAVSGSDVYAQNAFADGRIFADGFEDGGTSAWSVVVP